MKNANTKWGKRTGLQDPKKSTPAPAPAKKAGKPRAPKKGA